MRTARGATLLLLLAATGCKSTPTEVYLVIHNDGLVIPDELDAIHLRARNPLSMSTNDTPIFDSQMLALCEADSGCYRLPLIVKLLPGKMHPDDSVSVVVEGLRQGRPVVSDGVTFTFIENTRARLDIVFRRICLETTCSVDGQICGSNGRCMPLALEPFSGELALDAGAGMELPDQSVPVDLFGIDLAGADLVTTLDLAVNRDLGSPNDLSSIDLAGKVDSALAPCDCTGLIDPFGDGNQCPLTNQCVGMNCCLEHSTAQPPPAGTCLSSVSCSPSSTPQ